MEVKGWFLRASIRLRFFSFLQNCPEGFNMLNKKILLEAYVILGRVFLIHFDKILKDKVVFFIGPRLAGILL